MTAACVYESALSSTAGEVHGNVSLWCMLILARVLITQTSYVADLSHNAPG